MPGAGDFLINRFVNPSKFVRQPLSLVPYSVTGTESLDLFGEKKYGKVVGRGGEQLGIFNFSY